MSQLARKVAAHDRQIKMRMRNLYNHYTHDIGDVLDRLATKIIGTVAHELAQYDTLNYTELNRMHALPHMRQQLEMVVKIAAQDIDHIWSHQRIKFDLFSRVSMAFLDRQASPPWIPITLNLSRSNTGMSRYQPKKGYSHYSLSQMIDNILQQIKRGSLNGESTSQVIARVRNMFDRKNSKGVREANASAEDFEVSDDKLDLYGPVDITTGIFNENDIADLNAEFRGLNLQTSREYESWFTDAIKKNNRYLRDLEQNMMSDALSIIQSGQSDSVPDLKGIADMQWQVERPGVCPICDKRSNLTMTQIKAKMKDEFGAAPPPLHPWCRCELVPMMDSKWQSADLTKQGVTWDPATGKLNVPRAVQKNLRTDLNFDQFMDYVSKGGGQ